ncbi:DUF1566 domain-containing protein [Streptomyces sp. SID8379]|uniref:Lcl C-terminal domain-containing protein n=1 Tax=unclassified Streptomyces TaxID=2593676 RepID=UPI001319FEE6|nr:DUF1566 domain-containing protein [Streptomyces sp. HmicA12]MYW70398.1 DUF1566 domain-containing protein [Streptomyces sp. SID8379]
MDFDDSVVLRLRLSGQRLEVVHASRWLDGDNRIVLALWWLEAAGEMTRADIAGALADSPADADARISYMLGQLATARTVVSALATPRCEGLSRLTAGWDGWPEALWRERIADHVRRCVVCAAPPHERIAPELLFAEHALVPVPEHLTDSVTAALRTAQQGKKPLRCRGTPAKRRFSIAVSVACAVLIVAIGVVHTTAPDQDSDSQERAAVAMATSRPSSSSVSRSAAGTSSPARASETARSSEKAETRASSMPSTASASPRTRPSTECGGALAPQWANWPMPNAKAGGLPHQASYTDQGNGTVRDNVTCLLWQRAPAPRRHTFTDAQAYCARLNLAGDGWRLPSRIEVMSLVDTTRSGPAIDTAAFPGTPAQFFWTSSPWAVTKTPLRAWIVNFYEGLTSNAVDQSGSYQVRCVRGDSGSGRPAYRTVSGQVTDPATGLTWQRATAPGTLTPHAADAYCTGLTLGGRAWRLPTVKELATLVDDGRVSPAIDRTAFPDTPGTGAYWSASVFAPEPSQRWFVSYNDGITSHRPLDGAHVRCVS